jgi:dCMP deaminase
MQPIGIDDSDGNEIRPDEHGPIETEPYQAGEHSALEGIPCSEDLEDPRPLRDEYLMSLAIDVAARSNCRKKVVGAVLVQDRRIISTGYNGTIFGYPNCFEGGCPRSDENDVASGTELDRCVCVHAEQNALLSAAALSGGVKGADCWVTHEPCLKCTKSLVQVGVAHVYYWREYKLPVQESQKLRTEMRTLARQRTEFKLWVPRSDVLGLDLRYKSIERPLRNYNRARARLLDIRAADGSTA